MSPEIATENTTVKNKSEGKPKSLNEKKSFCKRCSDILTSNFPRVKNFLLL